MTLRVVFHVVCLHVRSLFSSVLGSILDVGSEVGAEKGGKRYRRWAGRGDTVLRLVRFWVVKFEMNLGSGTGP